MPIDSQRKNSTIKKVLAISLVAFIGFVLSFIMGAMGSIETAWTIFWAFCAVFGTLVAGGLITDKKANTSTQLQVLDKRTKLLDIVNRYNSVTQLLIDSYEKEVKALPRSSNIFNSNRNRQKEKIRKDYQAKYFKNKSAYQQERSRYLEEWRTNNNTDSPRSRYWQWLIAIGIVAQIMACSYTFGTQLEDIDTDASSVADIQGETHEWNAKDIPMPHLTDHRLYVSNPDNILSSNTVDIINQQMLLLDDSLGIESVVVAVNHVEGRDIFRFSQDIFDIYKVGRNDRGLVLVLAYEDHLFRTHTGRSLEGDFTDAESFRLQETYLIPSMKAAMPDSGMIYLTKAIYNTLKGDELPQMYLSSNNNDE